MTIRRIAELVEKSTQEIRRVLHSDSTNESFQIQYIKKDSFSIEQSYRQGEEFRFPLNIEKAFHIPLSLTT